MSEKLETEDQASFREAYEDAKRRMMRVRKVNGEWRIFLLATRATETEGEQ